MGVVATAATPIFVFVEANLDLFVTYDNKLAEAAVLAGLRVEQPGL